MLETVREAGSDGPPPRPLSCSRVEYVRGDNNRPRPRRGLGYNLAGGAAHATRAGRDSLQGGTRRPGLLARLFAWRSAPRHPEPENADVPYLLEGRDAPLPDTPPDTDPALCEDPELAARVLEVLQAQIRPA